VKFSGDFDFPGSLFLRYDFSIERGDRQIEGSHNDGETAAAVEEGTGKG